MTRVNTNRVVLADTGFWIALYDRRDEHHGSAVDIMELPALGDFLFPWPLHYELLRTRFVKNATWIESFNRIVKGNRLKTIDDCSYRAKALDLTMDWGSSGQRSISLVDMVLRLVIDDSQNRIREVVTFNPRDFHDVCHKRGIPLRSSPK
ncbi:MAG: hypothetical protein ACP5O7_06715 [Phycisphaerae bacterium]